eukprot:gene23939-38824_t
MTLAFFEDTGHYKANYAQAQIVPGATHWWGKDG